MVILLQDLGNPWTSFARGDCISTDIFIMISGLLTSYSLYKQLERTKRLDIPREYMSRLMRYSTQFCVMSCCNAVQVCLVLKNITVVSCRNVLLLLHVAIYHTLQSPTMHHHLPQTDVLSEPHILEQSQDIQLGINC